jgi:hypothetical protein
VLRGVAHRVTHVVEAALVHQVDDQLQLVHALEVGDLRLVARLDEGLEPGLDERADAAAQHGLLAEQVGLGLLGERRLDDAGARHAERAGVRQRQRLCVAAGVLVDRQERRGPTPFDEQLAHAMAGRLGRDHHDVDLRRRLDRAEADVEAVREQQRLAAAEVRRDGLAVQRGLARIRHEHDDHVGPGGGLDRGDDRQAGGPRPVSRSAALLKADADVDAAVLEVQRVGVPLRSVAEYRHLCRADERWIRIFVVIHSSHLTIPQCRMPNAECRT